MRWSILALVIMFLIPSAALAKVTINEIAWMGTDEGGANCEWIELYNNDDADILLADWKLVIENPGSVSTINLGSAANVVYSGIAAGGYYLISRSAGSCSSLSPGSSADWKGSFSISNEGAKLSLFEGEEERDVVDASTGWTKSGIGGNNTVPKKTAQRVFGGWITDLPTPRGENRSAPLEELPEEEAQASSTPVVTIGGTAPLVPVAHPVPKLHFGPLADRIVPVLAHTPYAVVVYDSTGKLRSDANVSWSFGDGGHAEGDEVTHAYRVPGSYTATVRAQAKGARIVQTVAVEAVPMPISVSSDAAGIVLTNDSSHLLDLSKWKLKVGRRSFTIPEDTVLASHASVVFPQEITGLATSSPAALLYPSGKLAFAEKEKMPEKVLAAKPTAVSFTNVSSPTGDPFMSRLLASVFGFDIP